MLMGIIINTGWFIFGLVVGIGIFMQEAIDKGFMIKTKDGSKYVWIKRNISDDVDINNNN